MAVYEILESTNEVDVYKNDKRIATFYGKKALKRANKFVAQEKHIDEVQVQLSEYEPV